MLIENMIYIHIFFSTGLVGSRGGTIKPTYPNSAYAGKVEAPETCPQL